MTMEKAAEIVRELMESNIHSGSQNHIELFAHFDGLFSERANYNRDLFAEMCGFAVLQGVEND